MLVYNDNEGETMNFNQLCEKRRSIRSFLNKPVEIPLLKELFSVLHYVPSWHNFQPTNYYVVTDEELVKQLKQTLGQSNQNKVADAPVLIVSTLELNKSGFFNQEPANELGNSWGYYDGGISDMHLCFKATQLGLGSLIMGIRDANQIRALLSIDETQSIMAVIAIGYPQKDGINPNRPNLDQKVHYL